MKSILYLFILVFYFLSEFSARAQIDNVIIEKYYISDIQDATDTLGGSLPEKSVTYRIFIDLAKGCLLKSIYGNPNHQLFFSSTEKFFNNKFLGKTFGYQINKNNLDNNTTALDSWISLGFASNKHFGILKSSDTDGSIVGGTNSDGGSASIPGGLLVNADPLAGTPLTTADGLILTDSSTSAFANNGFISSSGDDSSIFGSVTESNLFTSYNAQLLNYKGISGTDSNNIVLIAQLTTHGEIAFKINMLVTNADGQNLLLVADDPVGDEIRNPLLTYPIIPICGCKDPDYMEYKKDLDCNEQDSCKTPIVYGCTDPAACNFNPDANFSVPSMCCFPGRCNDRNLEVVCPLFKGNEIVFTFYPNPANDHITVDITHGNQKDIHYLIYDSFGSIIRNGNLGIVSDSLVDQMNISDLTKGLYLLRLFNEDDSMTKSFIKN
jgi:hypothetical protein